MRLIPGLGLFSYNTPVTRLLSAGCATFIGLLALTACATGAPAPIAHIQPGTLRWTLAGVTNVPTLDPALAADPASLAVCRLIYGGLVRVDAHMTVVPDGAAHWSISPNGKQYTFVLRHNLRFADGTRVTAADAAASLRRALGPGSSNGVLGEYLGDVAWSHGSPAIQAVGRRIVRIRLRRPASQFLSELAFPGTDIVDTEVVRHYGPVWTQHAVGFGPYRLVSWRQDQSLVLTPNPYYPDHPNLRRLIIRFAPAAAAETAFAHHRTDIVSQLAPDATLGRRFGAATHSGPALGLDYIAINTHRAPLTQATVRRALAGAVNRRALVQRLFGEAASPLNSVVPPILLSGLPPEASSPSLARLELAQSGHTLGRGIRPLRYIFPNMRLEWRRAALLRAQWRDALDIKIVPVPLNPEQYASALEARDFDLALVQWGIEYPDPADLLDVQLRSGAQNNLSGWSSSTFDRLLAAAASSPVASQKRRQEYVAAATLAQRASVWIPLDIPRQTVLIQPRVSGLSLTPQGIAGWSNASVR